MFIMWILRFRRPQENILIKNWKDLSKINMKKKLILKFEISLFRYFTFEKTINYKEKNNYNQINKINL